MIAVSQKPARGPLTIDQLAVKARELGDDD
jgi:hypothetical protein